MHLLFVLLPHLPGPNREVLIDRVIRHRMVAQKSFIEGKHILRFRLLCNSTVWTRQ